MSTLHSATQKFQTKKHLSQPKVLDERRKVISGFCQIGCRSFFMSLYSFFAKFDFEHFFEIFFYFSHGHSSKNAVNFFLQSSAKLQLLTRPTKMLNILSRKNFIFMLKTPKMSKKLPLFSPIFSVFRLQLLNY